MLGEVVSGEVEFCTEESSVALVEQRLICCCYHVLIVWKGRFSFLAYEQRCGNSKACATCLLPHQLIGTHLASFCSYIFCTQLIRFHLESCYQLLHISEETYTLCSHDVARKCCSPLAAAAAQSCAGWSLGCSANSSEPGKGIPVTPYTQQLQSFTKGPEFVRRWSQNFNYF